MKMQACQMCFPQRVSSSLRPSTWETRPQLLSAQSRKTKTQLQENRVRPSAEQTQAHVVRFPYFQPPPCKLCRAAWGKTHATSPRCASLSHRLVNHMGVAAVPQTDQGMHPHVLPFLQACGLDIISAPVLTAQVSDVDCRRERDKSSLMQYRTIHDLRLCGRLTIQPIGCLP